ncbi:MAG: hypothetical protein HRU40_19160 [Saprospiraceae bacterium]|nr:hypothetical protein [Saprospiraceae bacterium]
MNFNYFEEVLTKTSNYVSSIFAQLKITEPWDKARDLPMFLQSMYIFREATLLGQTYLLFINKETDESVSKIEKHIEVIQRHYGRNVIYIIENITSFKRRDLVDKKINFIVPGTQLYLPLAALDFRETFKKRYKNLDEQLGATAQVILLMHLYGRLSDEIFIKEIIDVMKVSKMNVSRAFDELISFKLATSINLGRSKLLKFHIHNSELWEKAQPHLVNPVKKIVWIDRFHFDNISKMKWIKSGELALSTYSMLMQPQLDIYAVELKKWNTIKELFNIEELQHDHDGSVKIELWRHDPSLLARENIIDPLSLLLSMENNEDERIEIAKEQLFNELGRNHKWYRD